MNKAMKDITTAAVTLTHFTGNNQDLVRRYAHGCLSALADKQFRIAKENLVTAVYLSKSEEKTLNVMDCGGQIYYAFS